MDGWDPNSITLVVLAIALVFATALGFRGRPQPRPAMRNDFAENQPHVVVTAGELIQVARIPDGGREGYYEAVMDFRILLRNVGQGFASGIKAQVIHGGGVRWASTGSADLAGKEKEELALALRLVRMPRLGPERENWLEATLRLEYQDIRGKEWYSQLPVRLKIVHDIATGRHACWWVEIGSSSTHGRIEEPAPTWRAAEESPDSRVAPPPAAGT